MIKFEAKANKAMWVIFSSIGVILIAFFNLWNITMFKPLIFSLIFLLTLIFTLLSYQESTNKQSMNMYHLIPINQNIKFWVKIVITLIAYPLLLLIANELFNFISKLFPHDNRGNGIDNMLWNIFSSQYMMRIFVVIWFFLLSASTLLAIVFKKFKVIYAILVYYIMQILMAPISGIFLLVFRNQLQLNEPNIHPSNPLAWIFAVLFCLSIVLFVISFKLFKRRQI